MTMLVWFFRGVVEMILAVLVTASGSESLQQRPDQKPSGPQASQRTVRFIHSAQHARQPSQRVQIPNYYAIGAARPCSLWLWGPNAPIIRYLDPLGNTH